MPPKKASKKEEPRKEEVKKEEVKLEDVKAEPEKRKAEEAKEEEPAKKEQKTDAATKVPEEKVEQEKDAPMDTRAKLKEAIGFNNNDLSLNVIPTMDGKFLTSLTEGGLQYLMAGARANVGVKSGRYLFETKILEVLNPPDYGGRPPMPRQLLRIGFSTVGSSLVLGEQAEHIWFDSEGNFFADKKKNPLKQRFTRDQTVAVLLNLDAKSPNKNTVSLFRDGERVSDPLPIPEALHGKVLYPHVAFRNIGVLVPFSATPQKDLPFKCRTIADAAKVDVVVTEAKKKSEYNVVFPVGFPDEGTFDWLDDFLKKNPDYVELSDRAIKEWAISSGLWQGKKTNTSWASSNDKPEFNFGLPAMDNLSVRQTIQSIAPVVPRNYVVMEVKSNLVAEERKEYLQGFCAPHFKKIAHVAMGEPTDEYKKAQLAVILQEKQDKLDKVWKAQKAESERKQKLAALQKEKQDVMKKKAAERAAVLEKAVAERKAAAAAKKAAEEGEAKTEEGAKMDVDKEGDDKKKEDEKKDDHEEKKEDKAEEKQDEKKEEKYEAKEEKKEDEVPDQPPKAELTEEESKLWFRTKTPTDLAQSVLNSTFGSFSVPAKAEGFDKVFFEWRDEAESKKYLRTWILEKKRTSKVEDLKPSQWFNDKLTDWQKQFKDFQAKLQKKSTEVKKDADGDDEDTAKAAIEKTDIYSVEDICDVGSGEPLFKLFGLEDWALAQLRFELFLLIAGFKKDIDDPDRVGIHETLLSYYYNKYYRKQLTPKNFGFTTNTELTALIADTVTWSDDKVLATTHEDDVGVDMFLRLTEEKRRERQRRLDAGDETARLKVLPLALHQASSKAPAGSAAFMRPAAAGSMRPAGLVPQNAQSDQTQDDQQGEQRKWVGNTRSTPYGQGAYGSGGFQSGGAGKGGGGNKGSSGGGGGGGGQWWQGRSNKW